MIGYEFSLTSNSLMPHFDVNPNAGREHGFVAYRARGESDPGVSMRDSARPSSAQ